MRLFFYLLRNTLLLLRRRTRNIICLFFFPSLNHFQQRLVLSRSFSNRRFPSGYYFFYLLSSWRWRTSKGILPWQRSSLNLLIFSSLLNTLKRQRLLALLFFKNLSHQMLNFVPTLLNINFRLQHKILTQNHLLLKSPILRFQKMLYIVITVQEVFSNVLILITRRLVDSNRELLQPLRIISQHNKI